MYAWRKVRLKRFKIPATQRENSQFPAMARCLLFMFLLRTIDPRDFQKVTRDEIDLFQKNKKKKNTVNILAERNIVPSPPPPTPYFKGLRLPISDPRFFLLLSPWLGPWVKLMLTGTHGKRRKIREPISGMNLAPALGEGETGNNNDTRRSPRRKEFMNMPKKVLR